MHVCACSYACVCVSMYMGVRVIIYTSVFIKLGIKATSRVWLNVSNLKVERERERKRERENVCVCVCVCVCESRRMHVYVH